MLPQQSQQEQFINQIGSRALDIGSFSQALSFPPATFHDARPCSYADMVVNWVMAEVASPIISRLYEPMQAALLAKIKANPQQSAENFTSSEINQMETCLNHVRGTLLNFYSIDFALSFRRTKVALRSLRRFNVIKPFMGDWKNFAAWAAYEWTTDASGFVRNIKDMAHHKMLGESPNGCPIAVVPAGETPVLIEGYKRSLFALQNGATEIDMILCYA